MTFNTIPLLIIRLNLSVYIFASSIGELNVFQLFVSHQAELARLLYSTHHNLRISFRIISFNYSFYSNNKSFTEVKMSKAV